MPVITLVNEGKIIDAPEGANLRKVLLKNGISPYVGKDKLLNCLGNGLCGTCRVEVVDGKGAPPITPMEDTALVGLVLEMKVFRAESAEHAGRIAKSVIGKALRDIPLKLVDVQEQ